MSERDDLLRKLVKRWRDLAGAYSETEAEVSPDEALHTAADELEALLAQREAQPAPSPWHTLTNDERDMVCQMPLEEYAALVAEETRNKPGRGSPSQRRLESYDEMLAKIVSLTADLSRVQASLDAVIDALDRDQRGSPSRATTRENVGAVVAAVLEADEQRLSRVQGERDKLREALRHMQWCRACGEDSWEYCDGGREALAALASLTPDPQEPTT